MQVKVEATEDGKARVTVTSVDGTSLSADLDYPNEFMKFDTQWLDVDFELQGKMVEDK